MKMPFHHNGHKRAQRVSVVRLCLHNTAPLPDVFREAFVRPLCLDTMKSLYKCNLEEPVHQAGKKRVNGHEGPEPERDDQ